MAVLLVILITLSLNVIVEANQITYTKINGSVHVETSRQHFAMYGQVKDKQGKLRIVTVNNENHYLLSQDCQSERNELNKIKKEQLESYSHVRENYLRAADETPPTNRVYSWTGTYSDAEIDYSFERLDDQTIALSSKYFPKGLSKVIYSGNLIIYVQNDGTIVMKTTNCLFSNEKILERGIKNMLLTGGSKGLFAPKKDDELKLYLKYNPIDDVTFGNELKYMRTYSEDEIKAMDQSLENERILGIRKVQKLGFLSR